MYKTEFIKQLKQTNTSVDIAKTKDRVKAVWKSATRVKRAQVEELAGVSRATILRVYNTGSISAKLVVPMAQVLDVNPFYLTGESDENTPCTDALLEQYLLDKGYSNLITANRKKPSRGKKAEPEVVLEEKHEPGQAPVSDETEPKPEYARGPAKTTLSIKKLTRELEEYIGTLSEEDLIMLLKAMLIRARADAETESMAMMVKLLLLS